jgi:hypothetical protein
VAKVVIALEEADNISRFRDRAVVEDIDKGQIETGVDSS